MPSTNGLMTFRYSVLNYAPTAISESVAPCLVLADSRSDENRVLKLFASQGWQQNLSESDREYIAAFIEHAVSLPREEIEQFLLNVESVSVGPLRPGGNGT